MQDSVGKITLLTRRRVTEVPTLYGVDVAAEEASGRLVQHVEGRLDLQKISSLHSLFMIWLVKKKVQILLSSDWSAISVLQYVKRLQEATLQQYIHVAIER